jgi:hypothetical protein
MNTPTPILIETDDGIKTPEPEEVAKLSTVKLTQLHKELQDMIGMDPISGFEEATLSGKRKIILEKLVELSGEGEAPAAPAAPAETAQVTEQVAATKASAGVPAADAVIDEAPPAPAPEPEKKSVKTKGGKAKKAGDGDAADLKAAAAEPIAEKQADPKVGKLFTGKKAFIQAMDEVLTSDDPVLTFSKEVEAVTDADVVVTMANHLNSLENSNEFMLGGVLAKLQANPAWWSGEHKTFKEAIEALTSVGYRKAMYCINIYTVLVKAEVPWSQFENIGWTKVNALLPVLVQDGTAGLKDWVAKAKMMTALQLEAAVKEATTNEANPDAPKSNTVTKAFKLHQDQLEVVTTAIAKAKNDTGTQVEGVALEAMAQSYMGASLGSLKMNKGTRDDLLKTMKEHLEAVGDVEGFVTSVVEAIDELVGDKVNLNVEMTKIGSEAPAAEAEDKGEPQAA